MNDVNQNDKFIENIFNKNRNLQFSTTYYGFKSQNLLDKPPKLTTILSINDDDLSAIAKNTLDYLEKTDTQSEFDSFKWKVLGYITIQDIFDAKIINNDFEANMFEQWYFYYESKYILNEAILAGLNGFYAASSMLVRLFYEFNLLQLYSFRNINKNQNYFVLENFLKNKRKPKLSKLIFGCVPNDDFSKSIKVMHGDILNNLSEKAAHPYHPSNSPKRLGNMTPGVSFDGIFFWYSTIHVALTPLLWSYYVNFPMLLQPVDTLKKFGFQGPVGLFIDKSAGQIFEKCMTEKEYTEFKKYSLNCEDYKGLLDWYNSQKDFSESEIISTWNKNEPEFFSEFDLKSNLIHFLQSERGTVSL